jgi:DNA-binding LytR/AlgR family response regulator
LHDSIKNDDIAKQRSYVLFYDDHNEMRLSIKREDVILIESADNYVCILYTSGNDVKKTMIRNTMKWVEKQLVDSSIQRCHRSYIINLDLIKVMRREKEGIFVEFGVEGVPDVPISKTYVENINNWLTKGAM